MDSYLNSIKNLAKEVKEVGIKINQNFNPDLYKDLNYMCKVFLERQLSQIDSLIRLENKDDIILISRSMFEGGLYLAYSFKNPEMCKRWRLYAFVIDIERMKKEKEEGKNIPIEVEEKINENIEEIDRLFKKANGSYHYSWYGHKTIRKIAEEVDNNFLRLYDMYYSPMSEYHHWGVASLVRRYEIIGSNEIKEKNNDELKVERAKAMLMALSSLYSTLSLSVRLNQNQNSIKLIKELENKLKSLNDSTYTEIKLD